MIYLYPRLYGEIVAHLLECLQSAYSISRGLAHDHVEVRIAAILSNLAIKISKTTVLGTILPIDITRQQLADLAGTTPETAIRVTRAMQRKGLILMNRPGNIEILKLESLKEIADL